VIIEGAGPALLLCGAAMKKAAPAFPLLESWAPRNRALWVHKSHTTLVRAAYATRRWIREHIWQARFYDSVVFTEKKRVEKLRYMHRNPVKRGLVPRPQQWAWSSYRHYADGERGIVRVNEEQKAEMRVRKMA
jgi:hypothetical protein